MTDTPDTTAPAPAGIPTTVNIALVLQALAMGLTVTMNVLGAIATRSTGWAALAAIIGIGVGLFILSKIYTGRNWMRVLLTIFAVIATLFALIELATPFIGYTWADYVAIALSDASLVLLWLSSSRPHFAQRR